MIKAEVTVAASATAIARLIHSVVRRVRGVQSTHNLGSLESASVSERDNQDQIRATLFLETSRMKIESRFAWGRSRYLLWS